MYIIPVSTTTKRAFNGLEMTPPVMLERLLTLLFIHLGAFKKTILRNLYLLQARGLSYIWVDHVLHEKIIMRM